MIHTMAKHKLLKIWGVSAPLLLFSAMKEEHVPDSVGLKRRKQITEPQPTSSQAVSSQAELQMSRAQRGQVDLANP